MKTKIAVFYDLHDTLINSKKAWLKAFKFHSSISFYDIKKDYLKGLSRKAICDKYDLNYDIIKNEYRKYLKVFIYTKFYLNAFKNYSQYIISNGSKERVEKDLIACKINQWFVKVYTNEYGMKPNLEYISKILKDQQIDYAIMIGNKKEEDVFANIEFSSYIIKGTIYNLLLYIKIKREINLIQKKRGII